MAINQKNTNLLGSFISLSIILLCILIFIFRMCGYQETEYWLGIILLLTSFPLIFLFRKGKQFNEQRIYFVQLGTMITFLLLELLLDYLFIYPFREVKWMAIVYVTFFFAATGGMIGIAAKSGKTWSILSILLFINMAALAFMQHAKTGM